MEESILLETVHRLRARLRGVRSWEQAVLWSLPGALACLGLVLVLKVAGRDQAELISILVALPLFCAGGALARWLRPPSLMKTAFEADRQLDSRERLLTATEWLLQERPRTGVAQSLLRDAAELARTVDPKQTFTPSQKPSRWAVTATLMAGILTIAPAWDLWSEPLDPAAIAVRTSAQNISELAAKLPMGEKNQKLADELRRLSRQLKEPGMNPEEAAARIARVRRELRRAEGSEHGQGDGPGSGESATQRKTRANQLRKLASQAAAGDTEALSSAVRSAGERTGSEGGRKALEQAERALARGDRRGAQEALLRAAESEEGEFAHEIDEALAAEQGELSPENLGKEEIGQAGMPNQNLRPGKGPADFGEGSTNQEDVPEEIVHNQADRQADGQTPDWSEEYKQLYQPERQEVNTASTRVKGQLGDGAGYLGTNQEARGAPRLGDKAQRTAEEVYLLHRREAEHAVARETIPSEYRDNVKDYFDNIDPRRRP